MIKYSKALPLHHPNVSECLKAAIKYQIGKEARLTI